MRPAAFMPRPCATRPTAATPPTAYAMRLGLDVAEAAERDAAHAVEERRVVVDPVRGCRSRCTGEPDSTHQLCLRFQRTIGQLVNVCGPLQPTLYRQ